VFTGARWIDGSKMAMRMDSLQMKWHAIGAISLCVAALCSCAVGPDFREPTAVTDTSYTREPQPAVTAQSEGPGGAAQHFVKAESVGDAWWHAFGSADLDRLVQQALDASPTLTQARMRLEQARHDYLAQAGTQWPQANASASAVREQINPAAFGIATLPGNSSPAPFTLYQANVNVSYTLDLFGANRRALEGLAAQIDYRQYQLEGARLTLAGNVVISAIRRASFTAQIDLAERILQTQETQLDIAEKRYQAGGISEADLLSQRSQVNQARAGIAPLRAQLAQADHQLSVYLGRTPAQGTGPLPSLNDLLLPTELPLTLPSTLARQRPDIRASEALLHQASANVGVATANLYPQITLTGSAGQNGTALSQLANVWSAGAGLTQPLFHGGQLRARRQFAQDAYEAATAAYRQTVLRALQQVADVLRVLEQDAIELAAREQAQRDAHAVANVAHSRYEAGGVSQLALLDAQRQELQTALDRARVHAQRLSDTAALYQALGARP
jgi:NodT family efflux transporter outer membrane factor (OMF) lipoprotein